MKIFTKKNSKCKPQSIKKKMTEARPEKVRTEDDHFCDMLAEKLRRMAEGPQKEYLKLEIHQLIVKAEYGTTVLGNHVPNFIPHVDQAN